MKEIQLPTELEVTEQVLESLTSSVCPYKAKFTPAAPGEIYKIAYVKYNDYSVIAILKSINNDGNIFYRVNFSTDNYVGFKRSFNHLTTRTYSHTHVQAIGALSFKTYEGTA
jgi:hypothetical protein